MGGKEDPPPEYQTRRGIVDWTDEPYSDLRLSPRARLNRQAGFTAARPAANWIPSSEAESSYAAAHNLETSARLCLARTVGVELRQDADCALGDWSGGFRRCVAGKIGRAKRGSVPEEDRGQTLQRGSWMSVSSIAPNRSSPVPAT